MAYTTRSERCPLGDVETWIFDLDNTLYPASSRLFEQVQARMNDYICERLSVDLAGAAEIRRTYFREHGTTMLGLMRVNGVDPHEFMAFVHDVDLACVPDNPELIEAMERLPGRKIIFTNGSVPHAERLLRHLGVHSHFSGIFDIVAAEFEPKPAIATYREVLRRYEVNPHTALMIEDMARNLAPAAELGMTTAWVRNGIDWAAEEADRDYIHYIIDDLAGFLAAAGAMRVRTEADAQAERAR